MPKSKEPLRRLLRRLEKKHINTARSSDLSDFQFVILCAIWSLTPMATVNRVIRFVAGETKDLLDVAQVFVMFERFRTAKPSWIRETGTERLVDDFFDTMYGITEEGRQVLEERRDHLIRLVAFSDRAKELRKMVVKPPKND